MTWWEKAEQAAAYDPERDFIDVDVPDARDLAEMSAWNIPVTPANQPTEVPF
ncbi:hypothetical protein [Kineosporia babensis]|uniref:Uncharacterized protein n=1 Tax=Kineosporia babensis TaxID=499548 RepID=A0A9X1NBU9_9ACTN|nr:hypothetical protein [Kineosporia babensis]MCD5310906.1 hypothetical protein [Kineosporia babensis]